MQKETICSSGAPPAIGPYSQAVAAGGFVFVSGQAGIDRNGNLKEGIEQQTEQALKNAETILRAASAGLEGVAQVRVYIKDLADYNAMNQVYGKFFRENPPSRAAVQAALPEGILVEFVLTAYRG